MSARSEWGKALQEITALGWIAFLLPVFAMGVGTIICGGAPAPVKDGAQATNRPAPKCRK